MQENIDQFALNDAAEVVAVESAKAENAKAESADDNLSISDLKGQVNELAQQTGKKDFKLSDSQNLAVAINENPDLAAKAAIVAQASQSNDVAFDSSPSKSKATKSDDKVDLP